MKRRRAFELHSALGVWSGLLLFVICWSGTTAVLSNEIDWAVDARQRVAPQAQRASWGALYESVLRSEPSAGSVSLRAPLYERFAARAEIERADGSAGIVYLDPFTAEVLGSGSRLTVQRFFRDLHMCLFDVGNDFGGYWFVGGFGALLFISALTPLVFYRRWWRGFVTLKTSRGARALWSDLHKLAGVWGLAFSLVISVTAIWYLVEWLDPISYPAPPRHVPLGSGPLSGEQIDSLLIRVEQEWPELRVSMIHLPDDYWGGVVTVEGEGSAWLVRTRSNRMMLDPQTGEVIYQQSADSIGWPGRWTDTADPLHFGDFGGLMSKLVWFAFGLLLTGMSLTGAYLHSQRLGSIGTGRARVRGARFINRISMVVLVFACALAYATLSTYIDVRGAAHAKVTWGVVAFLCTWTFMTGAAVLWVLRTLSANSRSRMKQN